MSPLLFEPDDADEALADFGVDLVCAAFPEVTRGLLDQAVVEDAFGEGSVGRQLLVLKVKAGAFGSTRRDLRVTISKDGGAATEYSIDKPLPRLSSLFDWYVLQPVRTV